MMPLEGALFGAIVLAWLLALLLALLGRGRGPARYALGLGAVLLVMLAVIALPVGTPVFGFEGGPGSAFAVGLDPAALWLCLFGGVVAALACWRGTPARRWRLWTAGAALSLLGALGVFAVRDAISLLIAWELMSLGGALMILGERLGTAPGRPVLFMLALLEVGAVALLAALLTLSTHAGALDFAAFDATAPSWSPAAGFGVGLLLLIGFGAKLGLLPFYEWYPDAYGHGSGASGALMSGIVLNAAFYALQRGLLEWLPSGLGLGALMLTAAVLTAILTAMYAFQTDDWRRLLSYSSAENAGIAVAALGACLLFRDSPLPALAALAWTVALLQLAGHALAKGALFLTADEVYRSSGDYSIAQRGWLRRAAWPLGVGAVFAGMSLAAMPPQAGFVSEWFIFQTVFHGYQLSTLSGRLVMALAGAGLALTAAVAFATFIKVLGLGLLGQRHAEAARLSTAGGVAVGLLGAGVLALAVGMPWWLTALDGGVAAYFPGQSALAMRHGLLLVPLTPSFAFISPTLLAIVTPLLALLPVLLLIRALRRFRLRRAPVWFGGVAGAPRFATTALTMSNALRHFYSFIYRPHQDVASEHQDSPYFVRRIAYREHVVPLFEGSLFRPVTRAVNALAEAINPLQSGHMNFYLGLVGVLLVAILALALI